MPEILALLVAERDRLNRAIAILGGEPKRRGRPPKNVLAGISELTGGTAGKKRGRRKMGAAARKAVSERMKKYWAARRKGKKS
jgi:hypothetical protein